MKTKMQYITLAATIGLLSGCVTSKKQAEKVVTTTPNPYILTPDTANRITIDLVFNVPEHYLAKRNRLVITPQLINGTEMKDEYMPVVLDAPIYNKKINRKQALDNYIDPYGKQAMKADKTSRSFSLPYTQTVQLPDGTESGQIVAVVSTDGCGACTGIDTIDIAAISNPISLMSDVKESLQLSWIEPEFVIRPKVHEGRGEAKLQFAINKSDINLAMGENRREMEGMLNALQPILKDTLAILNSVTITGLASADGSLAFNTTLSRNRAQSAKSWLVSQLYLNAAGQCIFEVNSRPEGWQPILAAMTMAGDKDSIAVKEILGKYANENDDVQERYIRRLSCWNNIKDKYLQKDRKVEYIYTYTIKSFTTDAELLEMYDSRPDAFNEEELLRVSTLKQDNEGKKEVYKTILKYFPQSQIGANNYALLLLREGDSQGAMDVLATLTKYSPEVLNSMAAAYVYQKDYEKAIELLQGVELPSARYNLGLLKAQQRKLAEAYALLKPFADLNSAIVALSVNENREAEKILLRLKDERPVAEYTRALTGARLEKDRMFYGHIEAACKDSNLKERAAGEADFMRYRKDDKFISLIK